MWSCCSPHCQGQWRDEEAFLDPNEKDLSHDLDLKKQLKIVTVCGRCGANREHAPQN